MKIFGKMMAVLGGMVALLLLLILLCHMNPGLAEKIGSMFPKKEQTVSDTIEAQDNPDSGDAASDVGDPAEMNSESVPQPGILLPEKIENILEEPAGTSDGQGMIPEGLAPEHITTEYTPPEDESLDVPSILSGLTGYEPIADTGSEITEPEAEQLKDELGYGNTGEGLTFDETMYPYYQMLDETGKSLYRQIYANANDLTQAFVPIVTTSQNVLKNAFMAVVNDHPELFWVDTAYSFQYTPGGTARMDLQFNQTANNIEQSKGNFESKAEEILAAAQNAGSDYDKEVQVHDDLIDGITYHLSAPMNQSAYSALVNGQTVCAGYARAYQYLLQQLGIPCYYCTGYAGENHAWNIVELEGDYYNVDPTWDDADPNTHDYFNCTDADFRKDHARKELSVYLPPCNGQKYRDLIEDETPGTPEETTGDNQQNIQSEEQPSDQNAVENSGENKNADSTSDTGRDGELKDKVLTNIDDYYQDCYDQAMAGEGTTITFTDVVADQKLARQIYRAYQLGDYRDRFMLKVMEEKGFTQSTIDLSLQELKDGTYQLTHTIRAQK